MPGASLPGAGSPLLSVVVSTFNRPDALRHVLLAYARQRGARFEVLVADDGSDPETGELVRAVADEVSYPLRHVFEEDRGFRLAAVRNLAVRSAEGDILLFTDGDCVPLAGCLERHVLACRSGRAHAGGRSYLGRSETESLLAERGDAAGERYERCGRRGHLGRTASWWKNRWYIATGIKVRPKFLTANASVHRADFELVNGFDERFEGWGYEDEDFARRLRRAGTRVADGGRRCLVAHLFHPVHVSHRPNARASDNYRYFRRGEFLTAPLRGYRTRSVRELSLSAVGDVPPALREALARRADSPARGAVEVLVRFGELAEIDGPRAELIVPVSGDTVASLDDLYRLLAERI